MKNKKSNLLKRLFIICVVIISIELVAMFVMKIIREREIDHFDAINDIIKYKHMGYNPNEIKYDINIDTLRETPL